MGKHVIILDGPRGAGKTTLGTRLVEQLGALGMSARYFKKGLRDPLDEGENMFRHLELFEDLEEDFVVVDRFVATEWVMSQATGREGPDRLNRYCLEVDRRLQDKDRYLHLILLPDLLELARRLDERNRGLAATDVRSWDMLPSMVVPLWSAARALLRSSDLLEGDLEAQVARVVRWCQERREVAHEPQA